MKLMLSAPGESLNHRRSNAVEGDARHGGLRHQILTIISLVKQFVSTNVLLL